MLHRHGSFCAFVAVAVAVRSMLSEHCGDKRSPLMIGSRATTFAILLFIFLRPVLNLKTVLPQETLAVALIDNSESMNIRDEGKETRAELLQKQFQDSSFFKKLSDKFRLKIYRFDKEAKRIDDPGRLTFAGSEPTRVRHRSAQPGLASVLSLASF